MTTALIVLLAALAAFAAGAIVALGALSLLGVAVASRRRQEPEPEVEPEPDGDDEIGTDEHGQQVAMIAALTILREVFGEAARLAYYASPDGRSMVVYVVGPGNVDAMKGDIELWRMAYSAEGEA